MKRTELRRTTPLRSTALAKFGRSRVGKPIPLKVRQAVKERANGRCEMCGCGLGSGGHMHHRKLRSQGGKHEAVNLIHIHNECHGVIHANPALAYDLGFLVRSSDEPAAVEITSRWPAWAI